MLTRRIIPCLDVRDGRVVKGLNFESIRDAGDPVELADRYGAQGADELVFLDITASHEKRKIIRDLVSRVARVLDIPFTVGGGVNTVEDARNILLAGADKVGTNTGAVKNPLLLVDLKTLFGKQCVVIAIDARRNYSLPGANDSNNCDNICDPDTHPDNHNPDTAHDINPYTHPDTRLDNTPKIILEHDGKKFWYEVVIYGGRQPTGMDAIQWARGATKLGAGEVLLTSIDADGTQNGYDDILTQQVTSSVSVPVIASGGCGSPQHMVDIFKKSDADAALAASMFHYESMSVNAVKEFLRAQGIPVRL